MSGIDDVVNIFNVGFFQTNNNNKNPIDLNIPENSQFGDFSEKLKVITSEATYRPPETVYLDGYDFSDPKNPVPTKIPLTGYFQHPFLDEDGNWDEEAEYKSYAETELEYKKEVVANWMEERGYDLKNNAALMKALLEKEA
ncbi:hypothetical protein [Arcobacter sp. F2176]|uniref:hypothetical protein n=1 Tax=Arcobacter sp. F2176 TaxID=2044511 RepID=UPI00100B3138|nr:hypothetical protein [Arcobacter sp. F2176]RXJ81549.1 hypothetical protein CRU95_06475 [Arcobacter sp. F2176]